MKIQVYSVDIGNAPKRSPLLFTFLECNEVEVELVPWDGQQDSLPRRKCVLVEMPDSQSDEDFQGNICACQQFSHFAFFRDCHACVGFTHACVGGFLEKKQLISALDHFFLLQHLALIGKKVKKNPRSKSHPPIHATEPA